MGRHLTILLRNLAFYFVAGGMSLAFAPLAALAVARVVTWDYFGRRYLTGIGTLLRGICGITVEVTGLETIPEGQVLFASAQQCTWENLFFPEIFGNPVLLVKNEMSRYPIVGRLSEERGYIPTNRGQGVEAVRSMFAEVQARKSDGRSFFIFPTGWRTGTNLSPPLQHGIAKIYSTLEMPCVPIAHNAGRCWPHGSWLRFPGRINVQVLPAIEPGLDKATFLAKLHASLFGATDDLLSPPPAPKFFRHGNAQTHALRQVILDARR